jgi:hypothetical protein
MKIVRASNERLHVRLAEIAMPQRMAFLAAAFDLEDRAFRAGRLFQLALRDIFDAADSQRVRLAIERREVRRRGQRSALRRR